MAACLGPGVLGGSPIGACVQAPPWRRRSLGHPVPGDRPRCLAVEECQVAVADDLLSRLFEPSTLTAPLMPASADGSRQRVKLFDQQLLPHADIPTALQDLFNLAEDEQLVIARGDYRPQLDTQGGFLRYRMSLPVKGEARAVLRFLHKALRTQKALALESVQFKREHAGASEVEARLQLALLVQLPPRVAGVAP